MRALALMLLFALLGMPAQALVIESEDPLFFPPGTTLQAANGLAGTTVSGYGIVRGHDGGDGEDLVIRAPSIEFGNGVRLRAGHGGDGGLAIAVGQPNAVAIGGSGGAPGRVILDGVVLGRPMILAAQAGDGGDAVAVGAACANKLPQDVETRTANATFGDADIAEASSDSGLCATLERIDGGNGGNATAYGGHGGPGEGLQPGGNGGHALAVAGRGANGWDACFTSRAAVEEYPHTRAGNGGMHGIAKAYAGNGGPGWTGGHGGQAIAYMESGHGGNGTWLAGSQTLFSSTDSAQLISAGSGGVGDGRLGDAFGGDGGFGYTVGGNGGSAASLGQAGDAGNSCTISSLDDRRAPGTTIMPLLAMLAILARRLHPTTPK